METLLSNRGPNVLELGFGGQRSETSMSYLEIQLSHRSVYNHAAQIWIQLSVVRLYLFDSLCNK